MTIDFSKPVQTRDGRKVRVLCTDGPNRDRPIVGFVEGDTDPSTWTKEGLYSEHGSPSPRNLINAPERVERWVPMFCEKGHGAMAALRDSREAAIDARVGLFPVLALLRITYEDGKPVSVALEDV